ncbi:LOW QUALITY PROTEIN: hypothetical protein CVT26_011414 [Gymnopilus dilepis]|uniref:Uncharacterized protein n=1 Tax=Gymnopilus dilepis TaxID=231916 RepID=A0A409W8X3_9AGAR|nr:LOW QUALITY PROTEIN: hypothetical protein CVT26_011414 [Gymnopilus dilepis]
MAQVDSPQLMSAEPHPKYWERRVYANGTGVFVCRVCHDGRKRELHNCKGHESTTIHRVARIRFQRSSSPSNPRSQAVNYAVFEDGFRSLLLSASGNLTQPLYPSNHPSHPSSSNPAQNTPSSVTGIKWNLLDAVGDSTEFEPSPLQHALAQIVQTSLDFLDGDLSDDEEVEQAYVAGKNFSERNDKLLMRVDDVNNVPSVKTMQSLMKCSGGLAVLTRYLIVLGDKYPVDSLSQILAQIWEVANPQVWPRVSVYSEDSGSNFSEARQAA